jgi:hypothetical protein
LKQIGIIQQGVVDLLGAVISQYATKMIQLQCRGYPWFRQSEFIHCVRNDKATYLYFPCHFLLRDAILLYHRLSLYRVFLSVILIFIAPLQSSTSNHQV